MPHAGEHEDQRRAVDFDVTGGFRFEFARAVGDEHQLIFGQRPAAKPVELVQHRMAAGRIFFARLDDRTARAGHVHATRRRFFIHRQVMKKRVLAYHRRSLSAVG